jgi:hypothetical protein
VKVLGSSKRRWTEGDMDGAGEVNGERGDVRHPFTVGLDFEKWKICDVLRDMSGGLGIRIYDGAGPSHSSKRGWMGDEMDGAGEINGGRGDVMHSCTAGFTFNQGEGQNVENAQMQRDRM